MWSERAHASNQFPNLARQFTLHAPFHYQNDHTFMLPTFQDSEHQVSSSVFTDQRELEYSSEIDCI